jgi:hypothetical protein
MALEWLLGAQLGGLRDTGSAAEACCEAVDCLSAGLLLHGPRAVKDSHAWLKWLLESGQDGKGAPLQRQVALQLLAQTLPRCPVSAPTT